jgi:hypothetical protein
MLKARHVIIALALLLAMLGDSWGGSRRPLPSHGILISQNQTQAPDQPAQSSVDQRGTEQSPVIVKIAPGPNAKEEADQAKSDRDNKTAADRRSEYITVSIAIASAIQTIVLIVTVVVMMCNGRRQLRAYISIQQAKRTTPHQPVPQFQLVVKNWGQTPAYSVTYWVEVKVCELASAASITPSEHEFISGSELQPSDNFTVGQINNDTKIGISDEQAVAFADGKIAFYIFGRLDFLDAFQTRRWVKFKFRYGNESAPNGQCVVEEIRSN